MTRAFSILLLLLLFSFILPAQSTKKITQSFENEPLEKVLDYLENQYQITFSYLSKSIEGISINVHLKEAELESALKQVLKPTALTYQIINDRFITIKNKTQSSDIQEFKELTLCGKILDQSSYEALAFASIFIKSAQSGTTTNEQGIFEIKGNFDPKTEVEISYVGYQKKIVLARELTSCPSLRLSINELSFSEVIVKEYIVEGIEQSTEEDAVVLNPDRLDVLPGLTESDVLQMVQILPGVQSPDESATGLHIRGGTPDQNLILWDGTPVYNSGHFFGMISAFNPYIVDDVRVFRSGFGAEFGGRISSVIEIESVEQIPEKTQGTLGLNLTHFDGSLVVPIKKMKSAFVFSGRRSFTDIVQSPTYKKLSKRVFQKGKIDEQQQDVSDDVPLELDLNFHFNDYNLKWIYAPNEKNRVNISFFGVSDQLKFDSDNLEEEIREHDELDLENLGWSLRWDREWNAKIFQSTKITSSDSKNNFEFQIMEPDGDDLTFLHKVKNEIYDASIESVFDIHFSSSQKLNFGYNWTRHTVDYQVQIASDFEEDDFEYNSDTGYTNSIFATHQQKIGKRFNINAGIRLSHFSITDAYFSEPRFSIQFLPIKHWQIKAGAGWYRQAISQVIEFNDLGLGEQFWVIRNGEEDFPLIQSNHFTGGFLYSKNRFQFEVQGYLKNMEGLSSYSPSFNDSVVEDFFNQGTGKAKGLDFLIKQRWDYYQSWLSYSLSKVSYQFSEIQDNVEFPAPHDRPHTLTWMHLVNFKQWQLSIAWNYASGKPYTLAEDIEGVPEDGEIEYVPAYLETNNWRLPDYHRLDFSLLYKFSSKESRLKGIIGLSVLNVYNRRNLLSRQYAIVEDDETEELELLSIERPLLGFTPNFVVRLKWQ